MKTPHDHWSMIDSPLADAALRGSLTGALTSWVAVAFWSDPFNLERVISFLLNAPLIIGLGAIALVLGIAWLLDRRAKSRNTDRDS